MIVRPSDKLMSMDFFVKEGFKLNDNPKVVKAICKGIERCEGECPCHNESEDKKCPCSGYTQHNKCCCNLYIPTEIWKDVRGFEGHYQISNFGRVYSVKSGKCLKPMPYRSGYVEVFLRRPGQPKKHWKIHRLVAEHFLTNPNNLPHVNHKDEDKINNIFTNLEWCDIKYNNTYNGRHDRVGAAHRKSVQQFNINGVLLATFESQTKAAKVTGIRQGMISDCVHGKVQHAGGYVWRLAQL